MADNPWRIQFPKAKKPAYEQLLAFMPEPVSLLFQTFDAAVGCEFSVYNKYQRYEPAHGWVYGYCRNYRVELMAVTIGDGCFSTLCVDVRDEDSLAAALREVRAAYDAGYEERYARITATKKANQIERSKQRVARERAQLARVSESVDPHTFNRFAWSAKVARSKLTRLYHSEARGMLDENLLDEVGYTFYARCQQAREIRPLLELGRMVCHQCGAVIQATALASATVCACGRAYTYREYRRSFHAANMPAGRATALFDEFADKWPGALSARDKMLLIDWLVHECHVSVMSGIEGRSVCVNLIEGSAKQLRDMLEGLAGK